MKKEYFFLLSASLLLLSGFSAVHSQSLGSAEVKAQMIKDWERAKDYTVDYLNTMPANQYNFRATDSVRSFAQQMLHLAGGNVFLMMTATGAQPPSWLSQGLETRASAQNKDSVMYFVTASYDYCRDAVQNMDMKKWGENVKVFNTYDATRFAMMNKTFEHQTHHRGQTTIYIREVGSKPPQERLF
jgi:uncharacterized damage-inducible protein DinB